MFGKNCFILLVASFFFLSSAYSHEEKPFCAFCDERVLTQQKFYEDEDTIALCSHKPVLTGHVLIIPKHHKERLENLTEEENLAIHRTIQKVHVAMSKVLGTSSYLILQKNGKEVGQTVPHVHFHYIPRKQGDGSALKFLFYFYFSSLQSPLSAEEMQPLIEELKQVMDS